MEPELLDRYMADGTAPAFAELARRGRMLDLENRLDHLPDVVWPEIFTGRNGADLGWYRLPAQLFSGETSPRAVAPGDFDLTAFWDHAGRADKSVAIVDVPYSGPSPEANGIVVRGWGTHDKPFGTTSDPDPAILDGLLAKRELVKRAEEAGRALMAGQNYRFGRGYRTVQSLVGSGAIGRVEAIHVDFRRAPIFHGFRLEMEEPLLVDMAVHHLDQARGLLAGRPAEVRALSFNPSWSPYAGNASALVDVVADDGAVVSYSGTWVGRGPETSWDGDWFLQGAAGALAWSGDEVRLFSDASRPPGRIARRLGRPEGKRQSLVTLAETGRAGVLAELAAAVREGREPEASGKDNLETLGLVFGAVESAASGRPVALTG
jgi:Oxidoreductase family, C-terminal alpha/beta domain